MTNPIQDRLNHRRPYLVFDQHGSVIPGYHEIVLPLTRQQGSSLGTVNCSYHVETAVDENALVSATSSHFFSYVSIQGEAIYITADCIRAQALILPYDLIYAAVGIVGTKRESSIPRI